MNSSNVIKTLRYYFANDADIQEWLGVTTSVNALKQIVYKDATYVSVEDGYKFPAITFKFNDESDDLQIPSNNILLELSIINSTKSNNAMHACLRIKDRLRELLINKTTNDRKQDVINTQGQSLGLDTKIRGVFWVSALTYDDKEQGSERLHRISCLIRLIVGD